MKPATVLTDPEPAPFEAAEAAHACEEALIVDLEGYEGPLDVLLALARAQKVDLLKLSVATLAEQYLEFVRRAAGRRFELAADYLVMAAWLTWLKSRLLLPAGERGQVEPAVQESARELTMRLARLAAMREAGGALESLPRLGISVFARGDPDAFLVLPKGRLEGSLTELMAAYISQRCKAARRSWRPAPVTAYALDDARARLRRLLPQLGQWTPLTGLAPDERDPAAPTRASFIASTLSASLELVREGDLEARQREAFAELYLRARVRTAAVRLWSGGVTEPREPGTVERMLEALLFAAAAPMATEDLAERLPAGAEVEAAIATLRERYAGRGVELVQVAGRWRFQTAADLAFLMREEREEPRRLSRAAQETLAIIAYHQPVSRAEIEAVRGVQASRGTLDVLLELGLVRMRGRRRSPGRPMTFGTTDGFLEHYGLASLSDLPGLAEMKAAGLIGADLPPDLDIPNPAARLAAQPAEAPEETPDFVRDFLEGDLAQSAAPGPPV